MGVTINKPPRRTMKGHRATSGNTRPLPVLLSLDQPGRLRVGHLLTLLSISSPVLYARLKNGLIPKADGDDGRPYWNTSTVRDYLAGGNK
ncbi:hypothetical protein [Paraburkholderia sp. C35]|uniref:hypothetical protein n=1 Tax=Paraburkholderia sp. C35 TaxID=2126993 RepID=UPI0013A54C09|nr:hypothetical protein [Paraburkholderia sp. C35]